jgi:hypothetical protein
MEVGELISSSSPNARACYRRGVEIFKGGYPMPPKPDVDDRSSETFWLWQGYTMAATLQALQVANESDPRRQPAPKRIRRRRSS